MKKKHRWATVKGKVVSVRFRENEYLMVAERAFGRRLSVGEYLRWLLMSTREQYGELEVVDEFRVEDEF